MGGHDLGICLTSLGCVVVVYVVLVLVKVHSLVVIKDPFIMADQKLVAVHDVSFFVEQLSYLT